LWEFQKFNILNREGLVFGTAIPEGIALVGRLTYEHGTTRQSIRLL